MKITRSFAPMSIQIETEEDLVNLKELLMRARENTEHKWYHRGYRLDSVDQLGIDILKELK